MELEEQHWFERSASLHMIKLEFLLELGLDF